MVAVVASVAINGNRPELASESCSAAPWRNSAFLGHALSGAKVRNF